MAQTRFIRFFNKQGEDCNFVPETSTFGQSFTGELFFPKVSVNLIESQNLYVLQEVTATFKEPQRRKLSGSVSITGGSFILSGSNTLFTKELVSGDKVSIGFVTYEVGSVNSDTELFLTTTPSTSLETDNFYLLDYLWYNKLLSDDSVEEKLVAEFAEESGPFFFYDVILTEEVPLIEQKRKLEISVDDGSGYSIDPLTGRVVIVDAHSNHVTPAEINMGFSSSDEGVFEENLQIYLQKSKKFDISDIVANSDGTYTLSIPYIGYDAEFAALQNLYLARTFNGGFQYFDMKLVSISEDSSYTYLVVKETKSQILSTVNIYGIASFKVNLVWKEILVYMTAYGEAEGEDERLRLTLENFGRKIDENKEYIFRDSDIKEDRTDYVLLNQKRKEMLLEGDKIFPYMGSYKGLINIINLFGYYDVRIKEYFLNVDSTSPDNGKFLAIPIAKSSAQKALVKKVWDLLPSKIYKKTSLFGLYYDLNRLSGEYDEFGVPIVVDDMQFSPEEVLIKLFGLKELLKQEYLPLNARIYDITGEGIYFERYNFETWNDRVDVRVLEIGRRPNVIQYPANQSYIRDLRRIDGFYVEKFTKLGYTGFLGADSTSPGLTVDDSTFEEVINGYVDEDFWWSSPGATLSNFYPYWVGSFEDYKGAWSYRDHSWDTMPPGIYDPSYNVNASYLKPLPDDRYTIYPAGAPVLIETVFEILWEECDFSWDQVSTLQKFSASYVASDIGGGYTSVSITDPTSTISSRGFVPGDYVTISYSHFNGTYEILTAAGNTFTIEYQGSAPVLLSGTLSYSQDISQISSTTNRLSWDIIGRGEYLDMRVVVEKYGETSYVYDSGRKTIGDFTVQYTDSIGLTYSRILDTVVLPYEGEYDISVYIYDITNNFTMTTNQYLAVTPNAEITAVYQKQNVMDNWDDMTMKWREVTFDWFYPVQSSTSKWEEADLSWDSLELWTYKDQSLKKNKRLVDIISIDRQNESVLVQGSISEFAELAVNGNFLYFERNSSELEIENYEVLPGTISVISPTRFSFEVLNTSTVFQYAARVLVKKSSTPFYNVGVNDFFYADVVDMTKNYIAGTWVSTTFYLDAPEEFVSLYNGWWNTNSVFIDEGVYAGTYAIEIRSTAVDNSFISPSYSGPNTIFYLKDTKKELYKLDGCFQPFLTDYDVDYAEHVIGYQDLEYDNLHNSQWDTFNEKSWISQERHSAANAGFVISRVSAGGTIQVNDNDTFVLSSDRTLNGVTNSAWLFQKAAMAVAAEELNSSTIDGVKDFEYEVHPSVPIFAEDSVGNNIFVVQDAPAGSTEIYLTNGIGPIGENSQTNLGEWIWVGREWRKILYMGYDYVGVEMLTYAIPKGTFILNPYNWHKQQFLSTKLFNEFYFFVLAKSKTPALNSLSEVKMGNGVEGEWFYTPEHTYTYPLKNTLLQQLEGFDVSMDSLYTYWNLNGKEFPLDGQNVIDSRGVMAGSFAEPFTYQDAVITPYSFITKRSTPVVFHDDSTTLPLKRERTWKIFDESTGKMEVESNSDKLLWNFQKKGKFTVSLEVADVAGNVSRGSKKTFVTVI